MTDHFAEAVEAMATQFAARVGRTGNLTPQERERIALDLTAALPHIRQMMAAELRAGIGELELPYMAVEQKEVWHDCADYLVRPEAMADRQEGR